MFDIANIKDNEDYLIFFKIIEKQYLDSLVKDGQVYFNLLSVYRKMEEEDGKVSIGDATEGLLTKKIQKYIGFQGKYYQIHGSDSGYNAKVNSNQCVFCSYAVGLKSFESKDNQIYYHKMPYSTIENICKDKGGIDNCVILVFDIDIIDRICNALKGRLSFCRGLVVYDNFDYIPQNDINSVKYAPECCFHKDSKYEYQKEFRIAAINDTNHPIDNLCIFKSYKCICTTVWRKNRF